MGGALGAAGPVWAAVWGSGWNQQGRWAGGMGQVRHRCREESKPHHTAQALVSGSCAPAKKIKITVITVNIFLWPYYVPDIVISFSRELFSFISYSHL